MKFSTTIFTLLLALLVYGCQTKEEPAKPNVILIMADDMGYECIGAYGSTSYKTPNIDQLASKGIQFSNCVSQPLCTPSRVKIMTGKYNYRNYDFFGHLNLSEYSIGNIMQDAGYETCIAGKWQLNGISYQDQIEDWNDNTRPNKFGFKEYCLWQLTKGRNQGERYADPLIEQNGQVLDRNANDYGPDIFANYIMDFIERNQDKPFFAYYPMVLVHDPFVPTPDSEDWNQPELRYKNDTAYFKDMVAYTDKIVGKIANKLKELGLEENTILIFTGDNGTHPTIYSQLNDETIQGAKGNTIDAGVHVPLIVSWPSQIQNNSVFEPLIEFSDFFPTLADVVGTEVESDGKSFYPLMTGEKYIPRETAFVHYDPQWGKNVNKYRNQFIRTLDYKLYPDGRFYNVQTDKLEKAPLNADSLNTQESEVKLMLEKELEKHPAWK
ncbi:sulfatase-like hydrolase/transferase [Draconibacterium sp. IB214405]|uniref:sulfatase-like hydrolase/transferase n=1 Tax=Draconibacterium sp. IB214405 TaxID=3097352 RepID=UPI002A1868BD|nr:sulfatase-like hydrolase/transferase [Draconibacterium sp. IB214405]MDX8338175.1 sulfatase-like hydrolase/transferase [Draconibacterium sp. IB214405]